MLFKRRTLSAYADSLAAYMPGGSLFASKNIADSNFRKLLLGMAGELFRSNGYLKSYSEEMLPDETNLFLGEWESALGIPSGCFVGTGTNDERRRDILTKLAALGVQTVNDFESLALVFDKVVTVTSLSEESFPPFDVSFNPVGLPGARFIIVVEGVDLVGDVPPYDVPFNLGVGESILECLLRRLKPANCEIIFRNSN